MEDGIPWKDGDVLAEVPAGNRQSITWKFLPREGSALTVRWKTHYAIRWEAPHEEERNKTPARDSGDMYEAAQVEGPEPPYHNEITATGEITHSQNQWNAPLNFLATTDSDVEMPDFPEELPEVHIPTMPPIA